MAVDDRNWTVKLVAETWLVAVALGGRRGAAHATAAARSAPIGAELAAILPMQGVAGFGTFEAGGAALMRTQGIDLATGLEAVLVLHAVVLALALSPARSPRCGPRRGRATALSAVRLQAVGTAPSKGSGRIATPQSRRDQDVSRVARTAVGSAQPVVAASGYSGTMARSAGHRAATP